MVAAAAGFSWYKLESLSYHTRDYPFYRQFCARILDPGMTRSYSLNPQGSNILRYRGIEGADADGDAGLNQTIHLEPVKYAEAAVYRFFGEKTLLAFVAALCFLPALYAAALARRAPGGDSLLYVVFALAYSALPSALASASYDLRPFALLSPFFGLALLSIVLSRPSWEVFAFFNLLFAAREEAIVLGLGLVVIAFVIGRTDRGGAPRRLGAPLLLNWAAWVAATVLYFRWTGYPTSLPADLGIVWAKITGGHGTLLSAAVLAAACVVASFAWRRLPAVLRVVLVLAALAGLAGLPAWRDLRGAPLGETIEELIYDPRYALIPGIVLLAAVAAWRATASIPVRRSIVGGLALVAAVSAGLSFAPFESAAAREFAGFLARASEASGVFELRDAVDKYGSTVVCDLSTHQALCHIDRAYVYERLPYWMIPGDDRYYPENAVHVRELIEEHADYIALGTAGAIELWPLLRESAVALDTLSVSASYTVLAVDRSAGVAGSAARSLQERGRVGEARSSDQVALGAFQERGIPGGRHREGR